MAEVRVQESAFDIGAEFAALTAMPSQSGRRDIGGIGCFVGHVRDQADGRAIEAMLLEHYPAMTLPALAAVAAEAERRWPLLGCTLIHRIGRLLPGEAIVLVLAASAHRQSALDATAFLIDWLKTSAPFWKQEMFADGTSRWVAARAADAAAAQRWREGAPVIRD